MNASILLRSCFPSRPFSRPFFNKSMDSLTPSSATTTSLASIPTAKFKYGRNSALRASAAVLRKRSNQASSILLLPSFESALRTARATPFRNRFVPSSTTSSKPQSLPRLFRSFSLTRAAKTSSGSPLPCFKTSGKRLPAPEMAASIDWYEDIVIY